MGFAVPISNWFGSDGTKSIEVKERLLDSQNGFSDFFEREAIENVVKSNDAGKQWLLLFLQEWLQQQ